MNLARAKVIVLFLTVAGLAVGAALAFLLFMPTMREVWALSDEIVLAHSELEAQYLNRKNLLSSGEKAQAIRGTMRDLATQFLPEGRELDFITSVEALAARNGVEERILLTVNNGGKGAEELRVGFDITLNGPSPAVLQAIIDLERMPTLLIFESAVVRPGEGAPGGPSFLSINLRGSLVAPPRGL